MDISGIDNQSVQWAIHPALVSNGYLNWQETGINILEKPKRQKQKLE
jgi:hypothetical protein